VKRKEKREVEWEGKETRGEEREDGKEREGEKKKKEKKEERTGRRGWGEDWE